MKIAVMGASGLLGAAVCRECLARGHKLLAYANRSWEEPKKKYRGLLITNGKIRSGDARILRPMARRSS
jgi:putative NADH-flavin reductase